MQDKMGDRLKGYEGRETGRQLMPGLPVYARIDGRSFSKFTKGMARPFDVTMTCAMKEVTKYLVEETNALTGYTQSDEISLCWFVTDPKSQMMFDGKIQKLTSTLSALATAKFVEIALREWPDKCASRLPTFDSRVFSLPNTTELYNTFLWRVRDCIKNSVSMAASDVFSHKELQGKHEGDKLTMMESRGVVWGEFPRAFKEGSWVKREQYVKNGLGDISCNRTRVQSFCLQTPFKEMTDPVGFLLSKYKEEV